MTEKTPPIDDLLTQYECATFSEYIEFVAERLTDYAEIVTSQEASKFNLMFRLCRSLGASHANLHTEDLLNLLYYISVYNSGLGHGDTSVLILKKLYRLTPEAKLKSRSILLMRIGSAYRGIGHYRKAERYYKCSSSLLSTVGQTKQRQANIEHNIATTLWHQGKHTEAENYAFSAFNYHKVSQGPLNSDYQKSGCLIADILICKGQKEDARKLLQETLSTSNDAQNGYSADQYALEFKLARIDYLDGELDKTIESLIDINQKLEDTGATDSNTLARTNLLIDAIIMLRLHLQTHAPSPITDERELKQQIESLW